MTAEANAGATTRQERIRAEREAWRQEGPAAWEECRRTGLSLTSEDVMDWPARTTAGEDVEMPACRLQTP